MWTLQKLRGKEGSGNNQGREEVCVMNKRGMEATGRWHYESRRSRRLRQNGEWTWSLEENVGSIQGQPGCWVKLGRPPPMLSYLSIATGQRGTT